MGFGILILIWIWSLVFGTPIFQILALYLDFEGAKNIHFLQVLIWGFEGSWRFLTGFWHLYLDLDIVTGLRYKEKSICKAKGICRKDIFGESDLSLSSIQTLMIGQIDIEKNVDPLQDIRH